MLEFWWLPLSAGVLLFILAFFSATPAVTSVPTTNVGSHWYDRRPTLLGVRLPRRIVLDFAGGALYAFTAVAGALWYVTAVETNPLLYVPARTKVLYAFLISVTPPLWFLLEKHAFERWLRQSSPNLDANAERVYFDGMTDHARAMWAAVIAVYAAIVISFGG